MYSAQQGRQNFEFIVISFANTQTVLSAKPMGNLFNNKPKQAFVLDGLTCENVRIDYKLRTKYIEILQKHIPGLQLNDNFAFVRRKNNLIFSLITGKMTISGQDVEFSDLDVFLSNLSKNDQYSDLFGANYITFIPV